MPPERNAEKKTSRRPDHARLYPPPLFTPQRLVTHPGAELHPCPPGRGRRRMEALSLPLTKPLCCGTIDRVFKTQIISISTDQ